MLARIVTALILTPLIVFLIFASGGLPFAVVVCVFSVFGAAEFYGHVRRIGMRPVEWAGLAAVVLFVVSARTYERSMIGSIFPAVLTLLLILSFCVELVRKERAPVLNVGATVFGAIYVGWLISHLVVLRGVQPPDGPRVTALTVLSIAKEPGAWLVLFTCLCTWACDTGAYFVGRSYGKTKIAPKLSPNKTYEGSVAGFVCSVVIAAVCGILLKLPPGHALAMGALFGVLGQLGDLSASAIKREVGIKDFGKIFPGHGGMLDRLDSLLFSAPAAYYYVTLFLTDWLKHVK